MKSPYCSVPSCDNWALSTSEFCMSHVQAKTKTVRDLKRQKEKRVVPISKMSQKRAGEMADYSVIRTKFLASHKRCESCGDPATQVHHRNGRSNDKLNEVKYFMAVCDACHKAIHDDPEWSRKQGYLLTRSV